MLSVLHTKLMNVSVPFLLLSLASPSVKPEISVLYVFFMPYIFVYWDSVKFHLYIAELQAKCRALFSLLKVLTYTPIPTVTITYPGATDSRGALPLVTGSEE